MLKELREIVCHANRELARLGLAQFTFGNASAIDRERDMVLIKPSGVLYDDLTPDRMVLTDLEGRVVVGGLRPSSDLATHLELYRAFPNIGGVVHTHSHFATVWAQARRDIPCLGTTHADHFHGAVPVTAPMSDDDIAGPYEANTGLAIVRRFTAIDPDDVPAVLVAGHGSFCWGDEIEDAVETAAVLEEIARLAYHTVMLSVDAEGISTALHDRHFLRKHGPGRYYGQEKNEP